MRARLRVSMGFSNRPLLRITRKVEWLQLDAAIGLNLESMSVLIIGGAESLEGDGE